MRLANTVFGRKTLKALGKLPRTLQRWTGGPSAYRQHPPVLANSFPKSGTHLLLQVLRALPGIRYYHSFLASQPSHPFVERNTEKHLSLLKAIAPGELLPGHLFHDAAYAAELDHMACVHYFIYRDPRDVVVSEAYYLSNMNRWHDLHHYFAQKLMTMEDRILTSITGIVEDGFPYVYPDIATRFARFAPWLLDPSVVAIRYEDLVSDRLTSTLSHIAQAYTNRCPPNQAPVIDIEKLRSSIDPRRSHTFRQGKSGGWRTVLTPQHRAAMKEVAGDLLVQLGYETGTEW